MKKWYLPAALLGVGSVAAFLFTPNGWFGNWFSEDLGDSQPAPGWSEAAQAELDRIEAELHRVAQSLQPAA